MENNNSLILVKNVSKVYNSNLKSEALKNITLNINKGDFCSITGPSGSGKSTLLHLLGALDTPTSGEIFINSKLISNLKEKSLTEFRRNYIGLVFQFHFLLPEFTALENLLIPQLLAGKEYKLSKNKSKNLLEKVGILHKKDSKPFEMSGGEQQRVAIARALVNDPVIMLADEPTGNLDSKNSNNIYNLLKELNDNMQQTILVVTHDNNFAENTNRNIEIIDGQIVNY